MFSSFPLSGLGLKGGLMPASAEKMRKLVIPWADFLIGWHPITKWSKALIFSYYTKIAKGIYIFSMTGHISVDTSSTKKLMQVVSWNDMKTQGWVFFFFNRFISTKHFFSSIIRNIKREASNCRQPLVPEPEGGWPFSGRHGLSSGPETAWHDSTYDTRGTPTSAP